MKKSSRIPQGLTLRGPQLDHYYHDFTYELAIPYPTTAAGVPLYDYGQPLGARHFPVLTTAYALALHEHFLCAQDPSARQKFLRLADALVETQSESRSGFGWEYDVPNLKWGMLPPWVSGMAQGLAMSALLRAYQLEPRANYLESAARALCAFERSASEGGCREVDAQGNVWYEETPSRAPGGSAHILNGFLFALWGLYDFARVTQDARAEQLYQDGVATLQNTAEQFDTGYWTRYALTPHNYLASRFYHGVHVDGMTIFHALTGDARFGTWAARWSAYPKNPAAVLRWRLTYPTWRVIHKLRRARTLWRLL